MSCRRGQGSAILRSRKLRAGGAVVGYRRAHTLAHTHTRARTHTHTRAHAADGTVYNLQAIHKRVVYIFKYIRKEKLYVLRFNSSRTFGGQVSILRSRARHQLTLKTAFVSASYLLGYINSCGRKLPGPLPMNWILYAYIFMEYRKQDGCACGGYSEVNGRIMQQPIV